MAKQIGKSSHFGAWRITHARKDQKNAKQRGKRREDNAWRPTLDGSEDRHEPDD